MKRLIHFSREPFHRFICPRAWRIRSEAVVPELWLMLPSDSDHFVTLSVSELS
jgi:hypothetical protein